MTAQEYIANYMPDWQGSTAVLQNAIDAAQAQIETYMGRPLDSATYEEEYAGAPRVILEKWPVTALTYLRDADGNDITDYRLDSETGLLWLRRPHRRIEIKYTAGYTTIPADIGFAMALTVQIMLRTLESGGQTVESERLGDWSATYATGMQSGRAAASLCPAAMALIAPYLKRRA